MSVLEILSQHCKYVNKIIIVFCIIISKLGHPVSDWLRAFQIHYKLGIHDVNNYKTLLLTH